MLLEDYWIVLPIHLFHKYFLTSYILSAVLDGGSQDRFFPLEGQGCIRNPWNQRHMFSVLSPSWIFSYFHVMGFTLLHCHLPFPTWEKKWLLTDPSFRCWRDTAFSTTSDIEISGQDLTDMALVRCLLSDHSVKAREWDHDLVTWQLLQWTCGWGWNQTLRRGKVAGKTFP